MKIYRYDAYSRNQDIDLEEDRFGPMSVGTLSLSERIGEMVGLGKTRFTVISGQLQTHFFLPIGEGETWFLSFVIKGNPSVDEVVAYFRSDAFLTAIEPLLGEPFDGSWTVD